MKNKMLKGTIILTVAGVITRVIGFLYRIFLANLLGDTKLGIYQMIFPIYGICFTLYASGLQTAVSQLVADPHLKNSKRVLKCGIFCSLCCSITLFVLLFTFFRLDKYSFAVCKRNGTIVKNTLGYISFLWNYKYYQWVFLWKTSCESTVHHTNY